MCRFKIEGYPGGQYSLYRDAKFRALLLLSAVHREMQYIVLLTSDNCAYCFESVFPHEVERFPHGQFHAVIRQVIERQFNETLRGT